MLMETDAAAAPSLITHPAHPEHALKLVATGGALFRCDGCRQLGADERRYRCDPCDFDLHECCAPLQTQQQVLTHSLLKGQVLAFLHSPPSVPPGCSGRYCDACGDPVLGFLYHNGERQVDLHPQCASLPERIAVDGRVFELYVAAPVGRGSCGLCGQGQGGSRARFWCYCYHSGNGEPLYMHVACILEATCCGGQESAPTPVSGELNAPTAVSGEVSAPTAVSGEVSALATRPGEVGAPGASSRRSGKFKRFCKVAWTITEVTISIASLDPVGVITAIADSL